MSPEVPAPPQPDNEPLGFTEREKLFDRISHQRLLSLLEDPRIFILKAEVNSNSFGEFLFVSTRSGAGEESIHITFFGLGFHEYRERWLDNEWSWYEGTPSAETDQPELTYEQVLAVINDRQAEIASEVGRQMQSGRGRLYEMLAELTDEDGALSELEDLGDLWNEDDFSF